MNLKRKKNLDEKILKDRTKQLGIAIIKEINKLPRSLAAEVIAKKLIRSGTSIGLIYQAACRAKSKPDMIDKLKIVKDECNETIYWLELLTETGLVTSYQVADVHKESGEILAEIASSIKALRNHKTANKKS
jgi:four helix bundle protein